MTAEEPKLSPELQADLTRLSRDCAAVQKAVDALAAAAVDISTRCQMLCARMTQECPEAIPLLAPVLESLQANVAKLTGAIQ